MNKRLMIIGLHEVKFYVFFVLCLSLLSFSLVIAGDGNSKTGQATTSKEMNELNNQIKKLIKTNESLKKRGTNLADSINKVKKIYNDSINSAYDSHLEAINKLTNDHEELISRKSKEYNKTIKTLDTALVNENSIADLFNFDKALKEINQSTEKITMSNSKFIEDTLTHNVTFKKEIANLSKKYNQNVKKLYENLSGKITRLKQEEHAKIISNKYWLYVAYGRSLDFLNKVKDNNSYYNASVLYPNIFHDKGFLKSSGLANVDKFLSYLIPSGFGFSYSQGRTVTPTNNPTFDSIIDSDTSWIKNSSSENSHIDETKLQLYVFGGYIFKSKSNNAIFKPAILGEFRLKTNELETKRALVYNDKLDPTPESTVQLNPVVDRSQSRKLKTFYGFFTQAEAMNMHLNVFTGIDRKKTKLIQVSAIHTSSGLNIGGEVRTYKENIEPEFEIHVAKAFGIEKLLGIFIKSEISGKEKEDKKEEKAKE